MPRKRTRPIKLRWLYDALRADGKTASGLADHLGIREASVHEMISGDRKIKPKEMGPIAEYLDIPVEKVVELVAGVTIEAKPVRARPARRSFGTIAVAGYIGAGAEIFPIDDSAKGAGIDEAELPLARREDSIVAVKMRGQSMLPVYRDGDILFYSRPGPDDWTRHVGDECVVQVSDGRMYLKILRRGSKRGLAILSSYNADDIVDVRLDWAVPIRWIMRAAR